MNFHKLTLIIAAALFSVAVFAQDNVSKIYQYTPGDGGIIYSMTRGNRWAIINLGTSASGGTAVSQLFDMETGEHFPVTYAGRTLPFTMASNDGNVIVGSLGGYAMTYNREKNIIRTYPNRPLWKNGQLVDVTPDGHYAVGYYEGYLGTSQDADIPNDWFYRTIFVDVESGDTIHTPNLPTTNRGGGRLQSIKFSSITPDARYIMGAVDWYLDGGYNFIYDIKNQKTITGTSLMNLYGGNIASRYENVQSCSGSMMSPDGKSIGGSARVKKTNSDGTTETISVPCVYYIEKDELVVYDNAEDGNVSITDMDNNGTFFGITETGTPLRNFKILYKGNYWVTLNQICQQRYGYNFYERTGYERTGTICGVSGDGHKFISFHDPMGESYCFDFGMSVEEACEGLDLLSTYSVTPEPGSQFSRFSSVTIQFERPVQILGNGKNLHLYDSNGKLVAEGLSSSSALTHKTGSQNTVLANFRTRLLTPGEEYTVVIDSGAIATSVDANCVNKEIRITYMGREDGPVKMIGSSPEAETTIQKIDNTNSYILLTFDCKVKLTETPYAYIERAEDGSHVAMLNMVAGTAENTSNQILLYPSSTINLYEGQEYRIIVAPGSICDYMSTSTSYNDSLIINVRGSYVRVVPSGDILFQDSWDDIAESLQLWLRYEGDHNTPLSSMQAWEFDADNQPWNFSIRESNDSYDYCAASHSLYAPSGTSDDWMLTPQISLPDEGKCFIEFDTQSYIETKNDTLEIYVYEQPWVLSHLNDAWMTEIKTNAKLVFKERILPGDTQENLSGEWTHYTIDMTPWNGKDIYIAFVNHNRNQSAIFIDNVSVQREVPYQLALDYEERVLALKEQVISGKITIKKSEHIDNISLVLHDSSKKEISRIEWKNITTDIKDRPIPFAFDKPLPLALGKQNSYSIEIVINDSHNTYNGNITNLTFLPVRRVVLEEMTGIDCQNCPQGIISIEKMQQAFGDNFIPISLHTYTGDPYESGMTSYTQALGLSGAPSARINRTNGIYYPMYNDGKSFTYTNPEQSLWYDVVSQQLDKFALCNLTVSATTLNKKEAEYTATVHYAIDAEDQHLSLLFVILEDSITNYQYNAFGAMTDKVFGEWGANGIYSGAETSGYAYPVTHNDVARGYVGTTVGGTIGLFPTTLVSNQSYTATIQGIIPTTITNKDNTRVVALLLDSQTGEVINAARAKFDESPAVTSIENTKTNTSSESNTTIYTMQGIPVEKNSLKKGIYIQQGRKILIR